MIDRSTLGEAFFENPKDKIGLEALLLAASVPSRSGRLINVGAKEGGVIPHLISRLSSEEEIFVQEEEVSLFELLTLQYADPRLRFLNLKVQEIPLPQHFDRVVCHHSAISPQGSDFFKECATLLKPNGEFLIALQPEFLYMFLQVPTLGSFEMFPLWVPTPKGPKAKSLLVKARKGGSRPVLNHVGIFLSTRPNGFPTDG